MWRWRRHRRTAGLDFPGRARVAFEAGARNGVLDLTRIAGAYVAWAEERGEPADLAEAYRMMVLAVTREALRRVSPVEQYRALARAGQTAAEAGFRLVEAGRAPAAATVLEHSRAVLLTRLTGGVDEDTQAALYAAGRGDLAREHLAAIGRRADAYRRLFQGRGAVAVPVVRNGTAFATGTPSELERAQAEITAVARRIGAAITTDDPLLVPSYDVIRRAARDAPIVYLASAGHSGYALVVRPGGDPQPVALPGLDASADLSAFRTDSRASLADPLRALADRLGPLSDALGADDEVALIPVGRLTGAPVHAALLEASTTRRTPPAVRYLPNARAAAGPRASTAGRVLVIDAAAAPGARPLHDARAQAAVLDARYRPASHRLPDATCAEVLRMLPGADVVQFLCHGVAVPDEPLSGGLELTDGRLTVGALMGRPPGRPQLVILAACESQSVGDQALNEAIGLPAAMMQAGATGVIAAQWQVNERAAMVLTRVLHEGLAAGRRPARALTDALCLLRTATGGELAARYPDLTGRRPAANDRLARLRDARVPYAEPRHWAAFGYTGR